MVINNRRINRNVALFLGFSTILSILLSCSQPKDESVKIRSYASSLKSFESFKFMQKYNPSLSSDVTGSIDQNSNTIVVFIKQSVVVKLSELKPSFSIKGSYVELNGEVQQSGMETVDFSESDESPLMYTVYAEDGSSVTYRVTVRFGQNKPCVPGVVSVRINRFPYMGNTLTAAYSYFDSNGDREGSTKVTWEYEAVYGDEASYVLLYSATRDLNNPSDVSYLNCLLNNSAAIGKRIRLTIQPYSDPADTTRKTEGVDQQEEVGSKATLVAKSVVKKSLADCVVLNEFRASTSETTSVETDDEGVEITIGVEGDKSEFIELYNPTDDPITLTNYSVEVSNGGLFALYVNLSTTPFVKPTTAEPDLEILPHGYFLITNSSATPALKKMADLVIDVSAFPSFPGIADTMGMIRLKRGANVIDLIGYGSHEDPSAFEGKRYADSAVVDKSLGRNEGVDSNQNASDVVVKVSTPMPSGRNEVGAIPPIVTNIAIERFGTNLDDDGQPTGDQTYVVRKKYSDANYDPEGLHIYRWRPFYRVVEENGTLNPMRVYIDGLKADGSPDPTVDPNDVLAGPFDSQTFTITAYDFDRFANNRVMFLEVSVIPVSLSGDDPATDEDEMVGASVSFTSTDKKLCVSATRAAKMLIYQIFPYRNIINLRVTRSGSLKNMSIMYSKYDLVLTDSPTEDVKSDYQIFLGMGSNTTAVAGNYIAVLTKSTAGIDSFGAAWDARCSIQSSTTNTGYLYDNAYPYEASLYADEYFNTVGSMVSVMENIGLDEETKEPVYVTRDAVVFAVGDHPSEKATTFKRYLLKSNSAAYFANGGSIAPEIDQSIWKVAAQIDCPSVDDTTFYDRQDDIDVQGAVNAASDYIKVPLEAKSYVVYRKPHTDAETWYFDNFSSVWNENPTVDLLGNMESVVGGVPLYLGDSQNFIFNYLFDGEIIYGIPGFPMGANNSLNIILSSSGDVSSKISTAFIDDLSEIKLAELKVNRQDDSGYKVTSFTGAANCTIANGSSTNVRNYQVIRFYRNFSSVLGGYVDTNRSSDFNVYYDVDHSVPTSVSDDLL